MSLKPGEFSFSEDRLRAIWEDRDNFGPSPEVKAYHDLHKYSQSHVPGARHAKPLCLKLYEDTESPELHVGRLDASYSALHMPGKLWRSPHTEQQVGIFGHVRHAETE